MSKYLSLVFIFLISCTKDPGPPSGDLDGIYSGVYLQTGDIKDSADTKILFVGSNFSGGSTGSLRKICYGSYEVNGDSINFKNYCSDPDPELLLVNKYKMRKAGDSLYFSRDSPPDTVHYMEQFSLKKQ